jgi:hypothetical protein
MVHKVCPPIACNGFIVFIKRSLEYNYSPLRVFSKQRGPLRLSGIFFYRQTAFGSLVYARLIEVFGITAFVYRSKLCQTNSLLHLQLITH